MIVRRYEKITEYFYVSDRRFELVRGIRNYDKFYKVREVIVMVKNNFKNNYRLSGNFVIDEVMMKLWLNGLVGFYLSNIYLLNLLKEELKFGWDVI